MMISVGTIVLSLDDSENYPLLRIIHSGAVVPQSWMPIGHWTTAPEALSSGHSGQSFLEMKPQTSEN